MVKPEKALGESELNIALAAASDDMLWCVVLQLIDTAEQNANENTAVRSRA